MKRQGDKESRGAEEQRSRGGKKRNSETAKHGWDRPGEAMEKRENDDKEIRNDRVVSGSPTLPFSLSGGREEVGRDWRQERVLQGYSKKRIVKMYASREPVLWKAEEILLPAHFPPGGTILDVGCGTGRTAIPLARMGYRVTAIDLAPAMIKRAQQEAGRYGVVVDFRVMDVMQIEFPDETFDDALFTYNGIELLPGMEGKRQAFQEVWRVLRSGGHFFFTSHSLYALNNLFFFRMRNVLRFYIMKMFRMPIPEQEVGERLIEDEFETGYMQIVAPWTLKRLAKGVGFQVVYDNTRKRVEARKSPGWFMDLEQGERCYVLQKKDSSSIH